MSDGLTFPLLPRRRVAGPSFGAMRSRSRGPGHDLAGARAYLPGDDVRRIDWRASARLSSARDADQFIVREHLTEEASHVVALVDGSPSMSIFPQELPWLSKPDAVAEVESMVAESARRSGCRFSTPRDRGASLDAALVGLGEGERRPPPGSFVFVLSDFFSFPPEERWQEALAAGWDVIPVVIQDPLWEQSFPDVAGAMLPLADPAGGPLRQVHLSGRAVREVRAEHEARLAAIVGRFEELGLDWVTVASHERGAVYAALLDWAHGRHQGARLAR